VEIVRVVDEQRDRPLGLVKQLQQISRHGSWPPARGCRCCSAPP
jgi:hypothetical protein